MNWEAESMDYTKTGRLIRMLRREKGLTQLQLAQKLHVSDKAVSKWERGLGGPDVSLMHSAPGWKAFCAESCRPMKIQEAI